MSGLVDKIKSAAKGPIKEGGKINTKVLLKEHNPEQGTVDLDNLSGRNLIVGVPGAFTPPCSSHVPGYVTNASAFIEKGVENIYIVTINDTFTTNAWREKLGASNESKVHFLSDDTGAFTKSLGLDFDATGLLGGVRSQRYVLIVEGGIVKKAFVESHAPDITVTSADNVLKAL
ncbi:Redoxin [Violaceomyces palustris]|uniref:Redoxin n=1 Tax=Violaceomyces palustris TaxID=1673888 RepID=A0ACD0NZZ0_9BASI|nr:Redoxin [Violaceomyces palustris]